MPWWHVVQICAIAGPTSKTLLYLSCAKEHKRRQLNRLGLRGVLYSPNKPIGQNKLNTFMKEHARG